jgi:hypothetical protein
LAYGFLLFLDADIIAQNTANDEASTVFITFFEPPAAIAPPSPVEEVVQS